MRNVLAVGLVTLLCGCGASSDQAASDPEVAALEQELAALEQQLQQDSPVATDPMSARSDPMSAPSDPMSAPSDPMSAPTTPPRALLQQSQVPAASSLTEQAFLAANERVLDLMADIMVTLDGVTDRASARQAAPRLANLTPKWQSAAKAGTAAYLALDDEEEDRIYKEAMQAYAAKATNPQLTHKLDIIRQMKRAAEAGGPAIEQELTAFRDAFLTTRGIYSPVRSREKMAKDLGPVGSPLVTD